MKAAGETSPSRAKELFTSDAYADIFNPEDTANPFAALYAEKLSWVLAKLDAETGTVVDLGGGPGRFTTPLAERSPGPVLHLDLSLEMLHRARDAAQRAPDPASNLAHALADAERIPLRTGSVDTVLAFDLLCHLPHPEEFLSGVARSLRPGGRLLVDNSNARAWWMFAYPGYLHPRWHWRAFWRTFFAGGVPPAWQGRVHHYRRGHFQRMVRGAGFEIEARRDFGPGPCPKWHLLIARKSHRDA